VDEADIVLDLIPIIGFIRFCAFKLQKLE
jgi:hypothetical protein